MEEHQPKNVDWLSAVEMEREMESLARDIKQIGETHGRNVLNLVIVVEYLKRLVDNARVVRYLARNYPEILTRFQKIVESRRLEDAAET